MAWGGGRLPLQSPPPHAQSGTKGAKCSGTWGVGDAVLRRTEWGWGRKQGFSSATTTLIEASCPT